MSDIPAPIEQTNQPAPIETPRRFCGIAVMAKASEPGLAKTRLVPPLTFQEAAAFNTAFLKDMAGNIIAAGQQGEIDGYMAYGPPGSEPFFKEILPQEIGLIETWLPNFGDCLFKAICEILSKGHDAACVLNSDSPTLPTALLIETGQRLREPGERVILGPSTDGGYYLLGMKRPHRRLFENIDWSTDRVARQTRERAAEMGLEVVTLPEWYDVDDSNSLRIAAGETLAGLPFGSSGLSCYPAPNTAAQLRALLNDSGAAIRLGIEHDGKSEIRRP